jgi:hypothetical protein
MIKIIQSSPPHTGSTLLLNLIHGFISPQERIHYANYNIFDELIHKFSIIKTHDLNIIDLENKYPQYKLFFVMSERNDRKVQKEINNEYKKKSNVLVINYDKLLATDNSIKDVIDYIFNEFNNFIPNELKPNKDDNLIKDDMGNRMKIVNETVEKMKDEPFEECDKFTGIHGHHRGRTADVHSAQKQEKSCWKF